MTAASQHKKQIAKIVRAKYDHLLAYKYENGLTLVGLVDYFNLTYQADISANYLNQCLVKIRAERSSTRSTEHKTHKNTQDQVSTLIDTAKAEVSTPIVNKLAGSDDYKSVCVSLKQFHHIDPTRLAEQVLAHLKTLSNDDFKRYVNYKLKPVLKQKTGIIDLNDIK